MSRPTRRLPDVVPTPSTVGHARDDCLDGAILGCGPHRLPDAPNY